LAVGGRLPRWPECHFPAWAENLSPDERDKKILDYIEQVVNRYKDNPNIIAWQVENEPFLSHFGDCPKLDKKFLDAEIALVKKLDGRPVVITDSGELSLWLGAARRADIFGTTMYRDTYSKLLGRYIHYPINPGFFHFKKNIVRLFAHPQKWIVIELQAEPWGPIPYEKMTEEERAKTMDLKKFREILEFSRLAGFKEFYLWGAEWWYWEKETNNNPALWNEAKKLF
ncbi:MAG: beta-galactosidase, partial [Patescibacteria group bacterium]|nr:beta-galactosidase [Patescibacteria group bacterium]